ncbi:MAG: DegV family EDD domain-containing protein [Clostridiales bacterium]|nr:DegV family EDD domain-containing protein [Clostridiales bacterium]
MKKFIILPDSNCDMSKELREQFGVKDYIKGYAHFSDGRDIRTGLEWDSISRKDFYSALSDKHMKISTSPASPEEYYEIFSMFAKEGYDIVSISISSCISVSYENSKKAAERIKAEYPDCEVYCCDSLRMSGSLGLLTLYAHELQAQGKSALEVYEWLESNKRKTHQMGPIDDLIFVARRGRLSMGKAIMGSFAGVKPMGDCNSEGYVTVLTKAKGIKKALALTVSYIKRAAVDIENQYVYVTHSDREDYALTLKEMIETTLHPKKVFLSDVFTGCGTNIGPGMICAYFMGEEISEDGSKEKEMMNDAIANCK